MFEIQLQCLSKVSILLLWLCLQNFKYGGKMNTTSSLLMQLSLAGNSEMSTLLLP